MSCTSCDWKAYALDELALEERRQAEAHAATCEQCRLELAQTRLTLDALSTLREEELPRRIAFVSDKVFEPRWYQRIFNPTFAAACVVAGAILVHAFVRPAATDQAQIQAAVDKAVAQAELQHERDTENMVAAYQMLNKQFSRMYAMNTGLVRQ
jgi:hypothetical protein